jgi:DNA processing protein
VKQQQIFDLIFQGKTGPQYRLRARGNRQLLTNRGVRRAAIVGSRKASPKSQAAATSIARGLAREGIVLVSGGASGIDRLAHYTALQEGTAGTIVVLPEGIAQWSPPRELISVWTWERALVVSQFADVATWQTSQAHARNGTIADLSDAFIAICAEEKSGTMNGIRQALKKPVPVFVPVFGDADMPGGNILAIGGGARAIFNRSNGPNLTNVLELVRGNESRPCI